MTNTYKLVNPYIVGDTRKAVKAKNSYLAARQLYENLSEHFSNSIPNFNITIMKGKNKFYSFNIKENRQGNEVKFSIQPIKVKNGKMKYKKLQEKINKLKKKTLGGARKKKSKKKSRRKTKRKPKNDDSDFSDDIDNDFFEDDSENYYKRTTNYVPTFGSPLDYVFYNPFFYDLDDIYIPTFYSYTHPLIHLWYL